MEQSYHRGEIYYVYMGEYTGNEQSGGRPGIIVSNDVGNKCSNVVEIVYLTTREKTPLPTHVQINSAMKKSTALCEHVHSIDKSRIGRYINEASEREMEQIDKALLIGLGIGLDVKASKKLHEWEKLIEDVETTEPEAEPKPEPDPQTLKAELSETPIEEDPRYVKVIAQRDVYKELYMTLIGQKTA